MLTKIYTDGACSGNPGPGGWAAIFFNKQGRDVKRGWCKNTTNNRMELTAIISAYKYIVECANKCDSFIIYTDSAYVANSINNGYLDVWKNNGWKTTKGEEIKNVDLWRKLIWLLDIINVNPTTFASVKIEIEKVKGHSGNTFNEDADYNARSMSEYAKGEGIAYEGEE